MGAQKFLLIQLLFIVFAAASAMRCDMEGAAVREGLLGQTDHFKWLGVLQVYIRDFDKRHVAMTGIVLIKVRYALANADDVARIPERVFKSDTVAVFIPAANTPYVLSVLSYTVHPEYEHTTLHSIALVELSVGNIEQFPLTPICLPIEYFKNSKNLYLTGYTDDNKSLEKVIYQIQSLNNKICDGYYDRTGFSAKSSIPSAYVCGYAPYSSINCLWDDGMALVSNDTGWFTLVGFSFHGPGCTAPARFIELYPYLSWIQLVTSSDSERFATPAPQPRRHNQPEFIPVHELFTSNETRRKSLEFAVIGHEFIPYFPGGSMDHYTIAPIERDNHTLAIYPFHEMHEEFENACKSKRALMYREDFELHAPGESGLATYKLSLYDLKHMVCICVTLNVHCKNRTKATLSFREEMNFASGTKDLLEPSIDINKYIPYPEWTEKPEKKTPFWLQEMHFRPNVLASEIRRGTVLSNDLYLRFKFIGSASLKFKMFASPFTPTIPEPKTTTPDSRRYQKARVRENVWGMNRPDRMYKEGSDTLVVDVHETVSTGSSSAPPSTVVVLACFLINVSLRTSLFIQKVLKC